MERREILAALLSVLSAGCIDGGQDSSGTTESDGSMVEEHLKECEKQYIRNEVVSSDETIDDELEPRISDTESREEGDYVELETRFGTTRSSENEPDQKIDYSVTAYYLVTDEAVYRTDDAKDDPRDGTTVDC